MSQTPNPQSRRNRTEATWRVFEILRAFSRQEPRLAPRRIAERTGLPLPTTYRYVALLREMGLLLADADGRLYLSPTFIALGAIAEAADPTIDAADPVMGEIAGRTHETVSLVRMVGGFAICVRRIDTRHPLRIDYAPGQPVPLEHGASGRILLSGLPAAEIDARLDRLAASDPEAARRLREQLPLIAERGWGISEDEVSEGIWAVSAAVRPHGETVAALTISVPIVRIGPADREALRETVVGGATAIADALRG